MKWTKSGSGRYIVGTGRSWRHWLKKVKIVKRLISGEWKTISVDKGK